MISINYKILEFKENQVTMLKTLLFKKKFKMIRLSYLKQVSVKFAQSDKIAQKHFCTKGHCCTSKQFCMVEFFFLNFLINNSSFFFTISVTPNP